jgi:hypothetical protein
MPCKLIKLADGTVVHLNMGRSKPKRCKFCNTGNADLLCDYPVNVGDVGHKKTCDEPMCKRCATRIAHEVDYCPNHKDHRNQKVQENLPL